MPGPDLIYFSGITLAILHDEARACLLRRLQEARGNGKRIAFDPNLRPGLWPDTRQMTEAVMQAAAVSDIVLPSFEDEAVHFGDPGPAATADRYAGAGALTVVVKNGADPVHFLHEGLRGDVVVPPVAAVVDTTSAGDSFNAGLLATMDGALPIVARIRLASYVAGQAVGGKGALVAFDPSELSPWLIPAEPGAAAGPGI